MNIPDNIILKVIRLAGDGAVLSAVQYENDSYNSHYVKTALKSETVHVTDIPDDFETKLNFSSRVLHYIDEMGNDEAAAAVAEEDTKPSDIKFFKIDDSFESSQVSLDISEHVDQKPAALFSYVTAGGGRKESNMLNVPTMIRCQNCETNFPTKYQYQRHQCEFNADKVVLKPDADVRDIEKGMRIKYDCNICGKQFVSKNNLERHQVSHENTKDNICEHCNKQFVSENRLRIHKENHCKKAGDISKFYRSDVAVWKCTKCHEVFSSLATANFHAEGCKDEQMVDLSEIADGGAATQNEGGGGGDSPGTSSCSFSMQQAGNKEQQEQNGSQKTGENKNVDKIMTEILLQCEFCNRTYADKNLLLLHQKTHTTERNYSCVNCNGSFDSYAVATQHWLKKCSERANLFYLPKLIYCEYCDRTFKSHEIFYTHKIKKKHYTPKVHTVRAEEDQEALMGAGGVCGGRNVTGRPVDSKDVIEKLIEDVLITLDVPVNKGNNKLHHHGVMMQGVEGEGPPAAQTAAGSDMIVEKENGDPCCNAEPTVVSNSCGSVVNVKSEVLSESGNSNSLEVGSQHNDEHGGLQLQEPEKKKRGRKRKWQKQNGKTRKLLVSVEEGYRYQCERCIKVFCTVADLETHRDKEHAASFNCDECGQVLHSAKALLIHSRAHKSLKPYVCDTCGRSYSQTSHLWQHMRFHQGIKPFACPHEGCEARYTIRPDLKDHIRKVHTRERPFKCAVCNKCFLTGSVYYQHRLIHTNDRRYGCDVCCKRFFRADALNNHKRIHTDERPYPCGVCGREFRQKGDRNKHVRTQHPDAIIS